MSLIFIHKAGINQKKKAIWIELNNIEKLEIPFSKLKNKPVRNIKLERVEISETGDRISVFGTHDIFFELLLVDFREVSKLSSKKKKIAIKLRLMRMIKEALTNNDVSIRELSRGIETSSSRVHKIINSSGTCCSIDVLIDICEYLGLVVEMRTKPEKIKKY